MRVAPSRPCDAGQAPPRVLACGYCSLALVLCVSKGTRVVPSLLGAVWLWNLGVHIQGVHTKQRGGWATRTQTCGSGDARSSRPPVRTPQQVEAARGVSGRVNRMHSGSGERLEALQ